MPGGLSQVPRFVICSMWQRRHACLSHARRDGSAPARRRRGEAGKNPVGLTMQKLDEESLTLVSEPSPTAFALKELTPADEARIGALVKKAVS
jgi:hypothetical protein